MLAANPYLSENALANLCFLPYKFLLIFISYYDTSAYVLYSIPLCLS